MGLSVYLSNPLVNSFIDVSFLNMVDSYIRLCRRGSEGILTGPRPNKGNNFALIFLAVISENDHKSCNSIN